MAHIIDKHGIEVIPKLGNAIENGTVGKGESSRIVIKKDNVQVWLKTQYDGKKKTYVVTGFEKNEVNDKRTISDIVYTGENLPETSIKNITSDSAHVKSVYNDP